jgi:GNAT superfamily N-acetyltransferase
MKQAYLDEYEFDDDAGRVDFRLVQSWLTGAYWSPGIGLAEVERGAENSTMVAGCYQGKAQVGYMRLISDKVRFGYIMDVFVSEAHRKRGIAENMVRFAVGNPELAEVYVWLLGTRDGHSVYSKVGFRPLLNPAAWMMLKKEKSWT